MLYSILDTFIVDSEAVDKGLVAWNPETAGLRIAVLRLRSEGTDFYKAKTEVGHVVVELAILVQSACKTYRVRKMYSENFFFQTWSILFIEATQYAASKRDVPQELKSGKCHVMGSFRIETEEDRL